jgi:hypothetical protein
MNETTGPDAVRASVAKAEYPLTGMIWVTNHMPMAVSIQFPSLFTAEDRDRAWEALRAIYEDAVGRGPAADWLRR